jgi:putative transposase
MVRVAQTVRRHLWGIINAIVLKVTNAVTESFFRSLKNERIRRRVYHTVQEAKADVLDYVEMFYNPRRRHGHIGDISPEAFERASAIG